MNKFTIYILFTALLFNFGTSQSLHYDVVRSGKSIGYMEVSRTLADTLEVIKIKSEVSFKILFSFTVQFQSTEVFYQGVLQSGSSSNTLNGTTQRSVKTHKTKHGYLLNFEGVPNTLSAKEITYTVSRLYFDEPLTGKKAFSQTFGEFFPFTQLGESEYNMTTPDGDNHYKFYNGVCTEVKVIRDYANYSFVMKPESLAIVEKEGNSAFSRNN